MADPNSLWTLSVAELLERFPQTASLFVRHRMACVGCDIAPFHTVAEAATIYCLDTEKFAQELASAAQPRASSDRPTLPEESD
ncbi:MAG: DUF1858 domain-containing protein [Anaerolineae bacterium]|nr:DUF1858 domain-containing protein [Anaerolineae bacterium]